MMEKCEFNHKELFIKTATALVESLSRSFKLNETLYDVGIDIANYTDPAYEFLETFISNNFNDKNDNIMECLFNLAEYGVTDVGDTEVHDLKTVEEVYDFYFKEE